MTTLSVNKESVERKWHIVDANGQILGRLASEVASLLRGKHKPSFTPHVDGGDHVIVINCEKIRLTGQKLEQKTYYRHSGYPGGLHAVGAAQLIKERPERMILWAVQGMLPKSKLGKAMVKKLKVYQGADHPHVAQNPVPLKLQSEGVA